MTYNKQNDLLTIQNGEVVEFQVLTWDEGYEFGAPCLMLSPVLREDSDKCPDSLIESVCLNIICDDGKIKKGRSYVAHEADWRGWNVSYLQKVYNQCLAGKKFPKRNYRAHAKKVKFFIDEKEKTWSFE